MHKNIRRSIVIAAGVTGAWALGSAVASADELPATSASVPDASLSVDDVVGTVTDTVDGVVGDVRTDVSPATGTTTDTLTDVTSGTTAKAQDTVAGTKLAAATKTKAADQGPPRTAQSNAPYKAHAPYEADARRGYRPLLIQQIRPKSRRPRTTGTAPPAARVELCRNGEQSPSARDGSPRPDEADHNRKDRRMLHEHTPGPWRHHVFEDGSSAIIPDIGYQVCTMAEVPQERITPNARLIASSPLLLSAAELAHGLLSAMWWGDDQPDPADMDYVLAVLGTAIEAAGGEVDTEQNGAPPCIVCGNVSELDATAGIYCDRHYPNSTYTTDRALLQ